MLIITPFKVLSKDEYYSLFFNIKKETLYSCEHIKEFSNIINIKYCPVCGKKFSISENIKYIAKEGVKIEWYCETPDTTVSFVGCERNWNNVSGQYCHEDYNKPFGDVVMVCKFEDRYICMVVNTECLSASHRLTIKGIIATSVTEDVYIFSDYSKDIKPCEKDKKLLIDTLKKYDTGNIINYDLDFGVLSFDKVEYNQYYYC